VADFELGLRHPAIKRETRLELQYRLAAALLRANDVSRAVSVWKEIEAVDPAYKDTVALLGRYREMSGNRKLQVSLIAPTADFVSLCRRLAVAYHRPAAAKLASISFRQAEYVDIAAVVAARDLDGHRAHAVPAHPGASSASCCCGTCTPRPGRPRPGGASASAPARTPRRRRRSSRPG
jgi:hypothetical protein